MSCFRIAFLSIVSIVIALAASAQNAARKGPIIRQVDHILVESSAPESLFRFFKDTLQLPEAWPLTDSRGFVSGGVGAGNVNIEFFRYPEESIGARKMPEARYAGLALQPYPLSDALRELKVCGIAYGSPERYISKLPDGSEGVLWTSVSLPSFSQPGMTIFLYEYSPEFLRVEARRQQLGNRLTLNHGGPLGIRSVREIAITLKNPKTDYAAWNQLLGARNPSGLWRLGSGPSIRLIPGTKNHVDEIIFSVSSLDRAKEFLKKNNLLGISSSKELSLDPFKVQGLKIRLLE